MNRHRPGVRLAALAWLLLQIPRTDGAARFDFGTAQGFRAAPEKTLAADVPAGGKFHATVQTAEELGPGWYLLRGECKTTGFTAMGGFVADAHDPDHTVRLAQWTGFPAARDWVAFRLYCRLPTATHLVLRICDAKETERSAAVHLRNLHIAPARWAAGDDLLGNGDFASGHTGDLPALWNWSNAGASGDYALVEDGSVPGTGRAVRLRRPAGTERHSLNSVHMPLPTTGKMTLSLRARAEKPGSTLNVLLLGDCYAWQKHGRFVLTDSWKEYRIQADCPAKIGKEAFCWVRIDPGNDSTLRLAGARVVWSETSIAAERQSEWIGAPGKNLVLNPDFELGWTGWLFDLFNKSNPKTMREMATADRAMPRPGAGPDGSTAFYLPSGHIGLISHCMPFTPGKTYTLSADVKGLTEDSRVWMAFIDTGWALHARDERTLPAGKWTRLHKTFTWKEPTRTARGYVRFNAGGGGVLLDRVQLEEGERTDYSPPPVMLGLMAAPRNIFARAADAAMTLKVLPAQGLQGRLRINVESRDAWGGVAWQRTITCPADAHSTHTVAIPAEALGVFHVYMTAADSAGRTLGMALSRYAVVGPAGTPDAGYCYHYTLPESPCWHIADTIPQMKQVGANWNRFFFTVKPTDGQHVLSAEYVEAALRQCALMREAGIRQIPCMGFFNDELGGRIRRAVRIDPADLAEFGRYVEANARALKEGFRYWEIQNEPNLWRHGDGPQKGEKCMGPAKYIQVLKTAYEAIKRADPEIRVLAPCMNGRDFTFVEDLMKLGMGQYMDIFSCHPYRGSPDDPDTYADLMRCREILATYGFHGPMMNTEQYYGIDLYMMRNNDNEVQRAYTVPGTEELRGAGRMIRNFIHHAAAGVAYSSFAPEITVATLGAVDKVFPYDGFAAANAASRFLSRIGLGRPLPTAPVFRAFLFPDAAAGPLLTLHTPTRDLTGSLQLAAPFDAFDIMGNPLSKKDLSDGVPLRTDPVYVRFPMGTPAAEIEDRVIHAALIGFGAPLSVDVAISGRHTLRVTLGNRHNRPLSGTVRLAAFPSAWRCLHPERGFNALASGHCLSLDLPFQTMPMENLGQYAVGVTAQVGDERVRTDRTLSPLFARRLPALTTDADLTEWAGADWIELGGAHLSTPFHDRLGRADDANLSARVACGWSRDFFAVAAEVRDNRHTEATAPIRAYEADSVQIYFDQLNNAGTHTERARHYDHDDITYGIAMLNGAGFAYCEKGTAGRYIDEANRVTGLDRDVRVGIARKADRTIYEILFPASALPSIDLAEGKGFGFSILINDNDGNGRKTGLTLAPRGKQPFDAPHEYRDLVLVGGD
ncbi:MAG: hypothetical protein JXR37_13545 [Kiritimatiellae bacterium]|nr:hypothetical protein [Kiritimatiellia bacterium]